MAWPDDGDEALVAELDDGAVARGRRRPDGDVTGPVVDGAHELVAVQVLVQPHGDPGVREVEALDRPGEQSDRQREDRCDLEIGLLECERGPGGASAATSRGHGGSGVGQQGPAGRCEPRAASETLEQRPSDLGLEYPDLLREGRRRDVHLLGGGTKRAFIRDRDKVLELAEVHG